MTPTPLSPPFLWGLIAAAGFLALTFAQDWKTNQRNYVGNPGTTRRLSASTLNRVANGMENMDHFYAALRGILIPRVPGTQGHDSVRKFIVKQLADLGWQVEQDTFDDDTNPLGRRIRFSNIVATLDPRAHRRLVLACHYDSKSTPAGFLGATDSAVPCAQIINLAKTMKKELDALKSKNVEVTLQLVFFDGEEAFVRWSRRDSLYGSRHLAQKWKKENYVDDVAKTSRQIDRMDVLVLLDLLGARNPTIRSADPSTRRWFDKMVEFERALLRDGRFIRTPAIFSRSPLLTRIEDDHIPFQASGVPVLHLISAPFPTVWHKLSDNLDAVDRRTVEHLNKVLRLFVWDYLQLQ